MTAIATDGTYLAADSLTTYGDIRWHKVNKIYKLNGGYFAYSGSYPEGEEVYKWLLGEIDKPAVSDNFSAIVTKGKKIYSMWPNLVLCSCPKLHAIGNGDQVCLAAMHLGESAVDAVKLAVKLVEGVGGRVNWVEL